MEGETMNAQGSAESSKGGKKGLYIIIAILVLAALAYFGMKGGGDGAGGDEMVSGNLGDLLARGGDWKCSWNVDTEGAASQGTIYVSGNKFASSITTQTAEGSMQTQGISDGEYMYTWGDAMPGGVKVKLDASQTAADLSASGDVSGMEQFAGDYKYDCDRWSADASMFVPPSTVTFTDLSAMMQQMPQVPEFPDMPEFPAAQ